MRHQPLDIEPVIELKGSPMHRSAGRTEIRQVLWRHFCPTSIPVDPIPQPHWPQKRNARGGPQALDCITRDVLKALLSDMDSQIGLPYSVHRSYERGVRLGPDDGGDPFRLGPTLTRCPAG